MRKARMKLLGSASAVALAVGIIASPAAGADPIQVAAVGAAPAAAFAWDGPYVGVHGGYGVAMPKLDCGSNCDADDGGSAISFMADGHGALGGLFAGFNIQRDSIVFGVEADVDWTGIESVLFTDQSDAFYGEVDFLASLRARLGTVVGDGATLAFATAGVAYIHATQTFHWQAGDPEPVDFSLGIVGGAGIEHAIAPGLSARVETLFYHAFKKDYVCAHSCTEVGTGNLIGPLGLNVFTLRMGVTAHF